MKLQISKFKLVKYSIISILLIIAIFINFLFVVTGLSSLHDYGSFIASGQLANQNQNPYSTENPLVFSVKFSGINLEGKAPNLNPPISILIFQLAAQYDPYVSINIWRLVSILLYLICIFMLHRVFPSDGSTSIFRIFWAVSLAGFWHTIQLGQIYSVMVLFTVLAWIFLYKKRVIIAGVFLGLLIAIKPNYIFWAILLLIAGNWKSFLSAGISAMSISMIALITDGIDIYRQWLEASSIYTDNLLLFPGNNSFQGLTARIGLPQMGVIMAILVAIAVSVYIWNSHRSGYIVNSLGIIVSLLISPIAWTGYTLTVLPIFFEASAWDWKLKWSAPIFSIPVIFSLVIFKMSYAAFVIFGWLYGWGLLILLFGSIFPLSNLKERIAARIRSIHTN